MLQRQTKNTRREEKRLKSISVDRSSQTACYVARWTGLDTDRVGNMQKESTWKNSKWSSA